MDALPISLDEQTERRLHALSQLRQLAPDILVRAAIAEYLDREEALEQESRDDEARWSRYLRTGRAVSHDAAAEWLDSIGERSERPCPR